MEQLISLIELAVTLLGSSAVIFGTVYAVWRFFYRAWRVLPTIDRLYSELGAHPVEHLFDLLQAAQAAAGELRIRQQIVEQQLGSGIYICDADGKCTWTNAWLTARLGLDSAKVRGWGWLAAVREDERVEVHKTWIQAVKKGLPYADKYWVDPAHRLLPSWYACAEAWPLIVGEETIAYIGHVYECDPPVQSPQRDVPEDLRVEEE